MGEENCRVSVNGEIREYKAGTTYQAIAEEFQSHYEHQIVLVFVGKYRLQELRKQVEGDCEIRFITTADTIGHATYKRRMCFLIVKAVHDVAGHDRIERVFNLKFAQEYIQRPEKIAENQRAFRAFYEQMG